MKKAIKKIICMILCFAMIFTTLQTTMFSASAKVVGPDNKTELTITTDKSKYSWGDTIVFYIDVKNVSNETLTGIRISSLARNYMKLVEDGDAPVISKLEPGETTTVQVKYFATKLVGAMAFFFPIIWLFSPAARILYRETPFNYEKKVKVGAIKYRIGFEVEYGVEESECILKTNKKELSTDSILENDSTIFFYAQVPEGYNKVTLCCVDNNYNAVDMKDNGAFSVTGDDIPNDGVFSAKLDVKTNEEKIISFYAKAENSDNKEIKSENVEIYIYAPLSDKEMDYMDKVDSELSNTMSKNSFKNLSIEEKSQEIKKVLNGLENTGYVKKESSVYDEKTGNYSFKYSNGINGAAMLADYSDKVNGKNLKRISNKEEKKINTSTTQTTSSFAEALFLHSFGDSVFRNEFYKKTKAEWDGNGINTEINKNITVAKLKSIDTNYEIICFSGHGSTLNNSPVMCTEEIVNDENRQKYTADLNKERISIVTTTTGETEYWVFPSLFEDHYNSNSFTNSFIFSECCEFFGYDNQYNDDFANVFINLGAKAVVGYHNSVLAEYSRDFIKKCVDELIAGKTISEAFNAAIKKHGANDGALLNPATPNLRGKKEAKLIEKELINGSFEDPSALKYWKYEGDVRIITKLGELTPQDKSKMAILTTGLGSMEAGYLAVEEGSLMKQTFVIPQGAKTLSFRYDVVSEEPMEYYNSQYDDKFIASLIIDNKTSEQIVMKTINSSTWYAIDNINFEGGDDTTYHTGWETATINVEKYQGKMVTLKFLVYDVGDSKWDTATLIDDVRIK